MFAKSYEGAPSFFHAWFVGQVALGLLGFAASYWWFAETVSKINLVGAVLAVIAGFFLIL
jgi:hypothetical protein